VRRSGDGPKRRRDAAFFDFSRTTH